MKLKTLEENQIPLYTASLILGASLGLLVPQLSIILEQFIEPTLALMLYSMFAQIPFFHLREAFSQKRFMMALMALNFIAVPILVWILTHFMPNSPQALLGVYLCLLTPCIDYVIVFTYLGGGNSKLMLAVTPLLLLVQMVLLPFYLWILMGNSALEIMSAKPFIGTFLWLIIIPLSLAVATEFWARKQDIGKTCLRATAWLTVPTMMLTLLLIVASQISKLFNYLPLIAWVIPIYACYMLLVAFMGKGFGFLFHLKPSEARTLIFSGGTRNSLVVLPLAIALPESWRAPVTAVIVTQTIVELIGELVYIRFIPSLVPDKKERIP